MSLVIDAISDVGRLTAFEEALAASVLVRPYLAKALLGWSPRKLGLIENIEVYYAAWVASGAGDTGQA